MASIATTVLAGFAFSLGAWFFRKADPKKANPEIERHNRAMEKLSADNQKWRERESIIKHKIEVFKKAGKEMDMTSNAFKGFMRNKKPVIEDYYKPSYEMKEYVSIAAIVIGVFIGFLLLILYRES